MRKLFAVIALILGIVLIADAPAMAACGSYSGSEGGLYQTTISWSSDNTVTVHKIRWQVHNNTSYGRHIKQCSGCNYYFVSPHDWSRVFVEQWSTSGCKSWDVWIRGTNLPQMLWDWKLVKGSVR